MFNDVTIAEVVASLLCDPDAATKGINVTTEVRQHTVQIGSRRLTIVATTSTRFQLAGDETI